MDDSCAVCADALDWVAYGPCGHREVCSTCVVRLRFVIGDPRCCICKTECPVVFVAKALGDYTRVVSDFSSFPAGASEGQAGQYWYHEDTQAYFDDADHYRMIRAMCRLSCSVCDKNSERQGGESTKRRLRFRSIDQLNGHLRHQHNLFMCNLCLKGRKVFICEQKLYTRSQLNQHKSTGDSEVDGNESERGGFTGHPMCEFCRNRFYGDNELYVHMSTEHYTCHICQRQHPGQYDYFKDYNDLEMHFRQEHFLCEDEACLEKKFIVFHNEADLKRHNTLEHGGHISRSKRNAALRIPTSFRYRRNEEEEHRGRGRGHGFRPDPSAHQLRMATQANLEIASDGRLQDSSSSARLDAEHGETRFGDPSEALTVNMGSGTLLTSLSQSSMTASILEDSSFPALADRELPEPSSRYAQALNQTANNAAKLGEDSFPPLPGSASKPKTINRPESLQSNTLAARLQRNRASVVINPAPSRPPEYHEMFPSTSQLKSTQNYSLASSTSTSSQLGAKTPSTSTSSQLRVKAPSTSTSSQFGAKTPSTSTSSQLGAKTPSTSTSSQLGEKALSTSASSRLGAKTPSTSTSSQLGAKTPPTSISSRSGAKTREQGFISPSSASSSHNLDSDNRIRHSASAPNLSEEPFLKQATTGVASDLMGQEQSTPDNQSLNSMGEFRAANKYLVERIQAGLGGDEERYGLFKSISSDYRRGLINSSEYLFYVEQFGLSHLVLELARLCPDSQKQKELIDAYNANLQKKSPEENDGSSSDHRKTKGKSAETRAKDTLPDNFLDTVRKLQMNQKNQEELAEELSKDGYRVAKDKPQSSAKTNSNPASVNSTGNGVARETQTATDITKHNLDGGSSKKKKASKFHRVRLGDGSAAALFDLSRADASPEGVWRSGGAQRLFSNSNQNA